MKHHSPMVKVTAKGKGHKIGATTEGNNPKKKRTMNYKPKKMSYA